MSKTFERNQAVEARQAPQAGLLPGITGSHRCGAGPGCLRR